MVIRMKLNIKHTLIFIVGVLLVSFAIFLGVKNLFKVVVDNTAVKFLASDTKEVTLYNLDYNEGIKLLRGTKLEVTDKVINNELEYYKTKYENNEYLVLNDNLVDDLVNVVLEKELYVRTPSTLYKDLETIDINGLIKKGEKVDIIGYDEIKDGQVTMYKVKHNDKEGYVYSKYLVKTKEETLKNYDEEDNYITHKNRGDSFGGGNAANLDYYPYEKPTFEDNVMPKDVRALYLNAGVVYNVDEYIKVAKNSGINAFVVDIKDNTSPAYPSKVMKEYSPTNYKKAINSYETYQKAIKKLKDEGFYVIGRITVFKDSYYVQDNPKDAILDNKTKNPYNHDGSYWPSAYRRDVWEFNVKLAIEAVEEMGFNEIQFDYVRFPDRTGNLEKEGIINFGNTYKEEKAQAIQ